MGALLDRFYKDMEFSVKSNFKDYIVKASELNSSFFAWIKRYRGEILGERQKILFANLKKITENIY